MRPASPLRFPQSDPSPTLPAPGLSPFPVEPGCGVRATAPAKSAGSAEAVGRGLAVKKDSATDAFLARPCAEFTDEDDSRQAVCLPRLLVRSHKPGQMRMPEHDLLSVIRSRAEV